MNSAYVTSKGQLVVPSHIRRRYGIKPGTRINFVEEGERIIFTRHPRIHQQFSRHVQTETRREIHGAGAD